MELLWRSGDLDVLSANARKCCLTQVSIYLTKQYSHSQFIILHHTGTEFDCGCAGCHCDSSTLTSFGFAGLISPHLQRREREWWIWLIIVKIHAWVRVQAWPYLSAWHLPQSAFGRQEADPSHPLSPVCLVHGSWAPCCHKWGHLLKLDGQMW